MPSPCLRPPSPIRWAGEKRLSRSSRLAQGEKKNMTFLSLSEVGFPESAGDDRDNRDDRRGGCHDWRNCHRCQGGIVF